MSEEEKEYINSVVSDLIMAAGVVEVMAELGTEQEYTEAINDLETLKTQLLDMFGAL